MIKEGIIFLYDRSGEVVDAKLYSKPSVRAEVIARWKRLYSAAYENCFLQIAPAVNLLKIDRRGQNTR